MTGVELLEKLVPLIPPTYANLTRFHGVFAPTSRLRDKVVPRPPSTVDGAEPPAEPQVSTTSPPPSAPAASPKSTSVPSTYRLDWASLLKRVFGVDVLKCSRCQGQMQLIACIEEPDVAKKILGHLGLRAEPLPTLRAQAPPITLELFPAALNHATAVAHCARERSELAQCPGPTDDPRVDQREPFGPRRSCARWPDRAGFGRFSGPRA